MISKDWALSTQPEFLVRNLPEHMEPNFLLTAPVWRTIQNNIVASKSEHDWPTLTLLHVCLLGVIQWSQYLNTEDPNVSISTNIPEIIEKNLRYL